MGSMKTDLVKKVSIKDTKDISQKTNIKRTKIIVLIVLCVLIILATVICVAFFIPHYQDIIVYDDWNMYSGMISQGKRNGEGTMKYANGDIYTGLWVNDKREGQGTLTSISGDKYIATWHNDVMDGNVELIYSDGRIENRTYINGVWQECSVSMKVYLKHEGSEIEMVSQGEYKVSSGDAIIVKAESSVSKVSFIGYYYTKKVNNELISTAVADTLGDTAIITVPDNPAGKKMYISIEAVASNDDGTANYVTKTGWMDYLLVYDD